MIAEERIDLYITNIKEAVNMRKVNYLFITINTHHKFAVSIYYIIWCQFLIGKFDRCHFVCMSTVVL